MSSEIVISGKSDCQGKGTEYFTVGEEILIFPTSRLGQFHFLENFKAPKFIFIIQGGQLI